MYGLFKKDKELKIHMNEVTVEMIHDIKFLVVIADDTELETSHQISSK